MPILRDGWMMVNSRQRVCPHCDNVHRYWTYQCRPIIFPEDAPQQSPGERFVRPQRSVLSFYLSAADCSLTPLAVY